MIQITFDCLPPSELYPNKLRKIHWTKRAEVEAVSRKLGFYTAKQFQGQWQAPEMAKISYLFTVTDKRIRDVEALLIAMKPIIDGIVDAGILKSDDCWHLSIGGASVELGKSPQTILTIEGI
uniref:Uncharacterized protein n=1 Tax=viral metagenome TaxID=1070528 RepID=A0A6M3J2V9_9ZZZZ